MLQNIAHHWIGEKGTCPFSVWKNLKWIHEKLKLLLPPVPPNGLWSELKIVTFVEGVKLYLHTWVTRSCYVICRRSNVFSENDHFDPCDPYVTFDPNLVMWHKWGGQPVLVTKSGQNRSSHVRDISPRSVDRRRKN